MTPVVHGIHQIAQRVADLDRAVEFYQEKLGLTLVARFDPPGLAFFDLGGTRLLLERGAAAALLYLRVDDIDSAYRALSDSGVTFEDEPHLIHRDDAGDFGPAGNAEWMVFFRDSEGNLLALVEQRVSG